MFNLFIMSTMKYWWIKMNIYLHTELVETKFNTDILRYAWYGSHHQCSWQLTDCLLNVSWLSWVQKSISTRFSRSMSELLWRYLNIIPVAKLPKVNNPQNLVPNLEASFPAQWTLTHGSACKRQCSMNGVPVTAPSMLKKEVIFR